MQITVVGTHQETLAPERATLHLSVSHEADEMAPAVQANAALVNRLRIEIEELKAARPSPITWFAVLPAHTRSWRPYNQDGLLMPLRYSASARLQVKFADFTALSAYAAKVGASPFVSLDGVEWDLTEATRATLEAQALTRAVQDAREKALLIAAAEGVNAVTAVEVAQPGLLSGVPSGAGRGPWDDSATRTYSSLAAAGPGEPDGIDLAPEDIEVFAAVHARFHAQP